MFNFKEQGTVTVTSMSRDLTYLTVGETYSYELSDESYVHFTRLVNGRECGTFEKLSMLEVFQKQNRISFA
jgi:hypothetical protein